MYVKPRDGIEIRDPDLLDLLPREGRQVPDSDYWVRRVIDGDAIECSPPTVTTVPAAQSAASAPAAPAVPAAPTAPTAPTAPAIAAVPVKPANAGGDNAS